MEILKDLDVNLTDETVPKFSAWKPFSSHYYYFSMVFVSKKKMTMCVELFFKGINIFRWLLPLHEPLTLNLFVFMPSNADQRYIWDDDLNVSLLLYRMFLLTK